MTVTLLSRGHMLIEGPPGTAKTLMAKLFAEALGLKFKRIQMTPDMIPSDIIGAKIVDPKTGELRTILGPIFANIVLIDEINRASPKTQSALLEAMQERCVTIEGDTYNLPEPFMIIATQNPWETEGVFPLPETQIDRFSLAISLDYPSLDVELTIVTKDHELKGLEPRLNPVVSKDELIRAINEASEVHIERKIMKYIVEIVQKTREIPEIILGVSPRTSVILLRTVKALAAIRGRKYVIPDDVKYLAPYILWHRIRLNPRIAGYGTPRENYAKIINIINEEILKKVKVPW
ncbi:MAG: magnesium chelatase [Thermoprotei archaeon]|nr:MAG: magnesium chelatase [Thermoprotei archaeon]